MCLIGSFLASSRIGLRLFVTRRFTGALTIIYDFVGFRFFLTKFDFLLIVIM